MATPEQISLLLAISVLAAACSPLPVSNVPQHLLADVPGQNSTCPFVVGYDMKSDRVPRIIKTISCDSTAPSDRLQHCVNLFDSVLVFNKTTGRSDVVDVGVGCVQLVKVGSPAESVVTRLGQN